MGFGFKQPLVGEKRCVTTLITAAKETSGFTELCKGKVEEIADVELDYARYLFAKNVK